MSTDEHGGLPPELIAALPNMFKPDKEKPAAPIAKRHLAIELWFRSAGGHMGRRAFDHLLSGGILSLPAGADFYQKHTVSLRGEVGPVALFYEGAALVSMTIGLHGFAIIGGLRPTNDLKLTGTYLLGYKLDIAETNQHMQWGKDIHDET